MIQEISRGNLSFFDVLLLLKSKSKFISIPLSLKIVGRISDKSLNWILLLQIPNTVEIVHCSYSGCITCVHFSGIFCPSAIWLTMEVVQIFLEVFIICFKLLVYPSSCSQRHIAHVVIIQIVIRLLELEVIMTFIIPVGEIQSIHFLIDHNICICIKLKYLKRRFQIRVKL